jgi:pyridoxal phosphate enzyme (YggS family)
VSDFADRLAAVQSQIDGACRDAGRSPATVRLLAVSKTRPGGTVREAYAAGCRWFGENRLQELRDKASELEDLDVRWSVIGHVQRNKAALVVAVADELQSLDSLELAAELDRRLAEADRTLDVLVQVNTSGEASKSGLEPAEVSEFAVGLRRYPRLVPRGLMTIALPSPDQEQVAACFDRLVAVRQQLRSLAGDGWDELSMGMSGDFGLAIARGATCVRIGSALFGPRS